MNQYVTGSMIRELRERQGMTQTKLADMLGVSDKTVSKWETGRGYPDIAMIEPLAKTLGVSVIELMTGESVINTNRSSNLLKSRFYVCPICGNVVFTTGEAVISCCGILLPACEPEPADDGHEVSVEIIEDEYYISLRHEMSRKHYISFIAGVNDESCTLKKLYPEGAADARFPIRRTKWIYVYCNQHGLYRVRASEKV